MKKILLETTEDKVACTKKTLVLQNLGWLTTSKIDYTKKKLDSAKFETKTLDCGTEGLRYFYKTKTAPVVTEKWKCNGSGPCVKSSSGTYNSKAECETATACDSGNVTPPPSTTYSVCSGPNYEKWCKDSGAPNPNGTIYKVQGCIGASQDSKFGPKTEKALKAKTGKTTFKESDVENICKGVSVDDQSTNNQGGAMTPEKQKEFFEKLSGTGRIYDGYIQELKSNSDTLLKDGSILRYCYVKKFECTRNEQGKITAIGNGIPISGKADVTFSPNHLFVILFPDLLYGYMEKRSEIITNTSYTWSPGDASASNVFLESKRRRKLSEQKIDFAPILGGSWNFSPTNTTNQSSNNTTTQGSNNTTTQGSSSTSVSSNFNEAEETEKVMGPIKEKALKLIDEWDESNSKKLAINMAKGKINTEIDNARAQIQGKNPKDFCSPQNKAELAKAKEDIAKKKAELSLALSKEDELYMSQLESLLGQVESECVKIEKKKRQSQNTSGNQGSGSQGSGSQGSAIVVSGSRKDELRKLFGFVDEDGNTMSPKTTISKMNKNPEKGFVTGMGSLQYAINNYEARSEWFEDFNELMDAEGLSDFKLKFPDNFEDEEYAGEEIDKENYSALTPINSDAKSQYKKFTFGNFFGNESRLPIFQVQSGSGEFGVKKTKCSGNPRQKLIDYLNAALSGSMSFRGSNELDYFERCLATNKLQPQFENEGPLRRSDFTEVDPDKLPFNAFNNKLGLKEIIRLLRGEEVNGAEIENGYLIDKDFYTERFSVYESVKKTVKKNLNEAIAKKKNLKLTESALTKILTNIKRKGY
jgi:hypothetical protein